MRIFISFCFSCCFIILLNACSHTAKQASTGVQPWEKDLLAKPEMQLNHPFDTASDGHIYFSKEASSGGQGFAAGGCGCN